VKNAAMLVSSVNATGDCGNFTGRPFRSDFLPRAKPSSGAIAACEDIVAVLAIALVNEPQHGTTIVRDIDRHVVDPNLSRLETISSSEASSPKR
jgi:hypothetical protein